MNEPAKIIHQSESRSFMEGPEYCREYLKTDKLWFGTSSLAPGMRGNIDVGHPVSQEVFFVVQGHVLIYDEERYYELNEGDALWIPEGLPHTLINIGDNKALLVWAGAPGQ